MALWNRALYMVSCLYISIHHKSLWVYILKTIRNLYIFHYHYAVAEGNAYELPMNQTRFHAQCRDRTPNLHTEATSPATSMYMCVYIVLPHVPSTCHIDRPQNASPMPGSRRHWRSGNQPETLERWLTPVFYSESSGWPGIAMSQGSNRQDIIKFVPSPEPILTCHQCGPVELN